MVDGSKYHSEIAEKMKNFASTSRGVDITKCPLAIDEIGREAKEVMDFRNVTCPIAELISARADKPIITHGTTNFSFRELTHEDNYGEMIGDRMRAMFNFIKLSGKSRRISSSSSLGSALAYNINKVAKGKAEVLSTNKIFCPADGAFKTADVLSDSRLAESTPR